MTAFDIRETYLTFLRDDADMTMPVAAIEALVALLAHNQPSTSAELIQMLADAAQQLKDGFKNTVSLTAGCDLFTRFVLRHINDYGDWEACKQHLVANGKLFAERAKASRQKIVAAGLPFIKDDNVLLVHSQSRAVMSLLLAAAQNHVRFKVFVTESRISNHGQTMASTLRSNNIPVCVIPDSMVGFVIDKVDKVFFGAEGVAESGGVINQMGSYQVAVIAKTASKPVYVCAESHKFVRLFPISPSDIETEFPLTFTTEDVALDVRQTPQVDFTPHQFLTALITDFGVLTPSAVSEELIKIWFN